MANFLERWGGKLYKIRWLIICIWLVIISIGIFFGSQLTSILSGGGWDVNGSEPLKAKNLMAKGFIGRGSSSLVLVVRDPQSEAGTPKYNEKLMILTNYLKNEKDVESIYTWIDAPNEVKQEMIGRDKHTSLGFVGLKIDENHAINILPSLHKRLIDKAKSINVEAYLEGAPSFWGDVEEYSNEGLEKVEIVLLPLVLIVLLFLFRSIISALTPLIVTIVSVIVSMGIIYFVASKVELSLFVTNAVTMLGLGLGIDYSLFMVSRFKDELKKHEDKQRAIKTALATSGHTVFFSGITVILAMSVLYIVPLPAIRSISIGAVIVVFVSVLSSLSLLPAILSVLGNNINKGKVPFINSEKSKKKTKWYKISQTIMRRPVLFLIIGVVVLLIFAFPALKLKTFTPDITILPDDSPVKKGYYILRESFGEGSTGPILVVIHSENGNITTEENLNFIQRLTDNLNKIKDVGKVYSLHDIFRGIDSKEVSKLLNKNYSDMTKEQKLLVNRFVNSPKDTAVIDIDPPSTSASEHSKNLVNLIRNKVVQDEKLPAGVSVSIGGLPAEGIETNKIIQDNLILVLVMVMVICYVSMLIAFKSVFLPLKALILNLLSVGASYGILVFVFAQGNGAKFFNVTANGCIQDFVPLMLLCLLFSLSTDYEVFILNRVKEEYERTKDNEKSVSIAIASTAPLISGAALLIVTVFGGFAFSNMLPIQTLGFGAAVAVAIDATMVRFVLVPVTMKLLGKWNWWTPGKKGK